MITHEERMQLAHDLCTRLETEYPGQILVGGVYGSTARAEDTPWSDLDLLFIVRDGCPVSTRDLLYCDTSVKLQVIEQSKLERTLTEPSLKWPITMGILDVLQLLCGRLARLQEWIIMGRSAPEQAFKDALESALPGLVTESFGRVHSCALRGDRRDLRPAVWEVLFEMLDALCLLNRRWVTHDYYKGLEDSFKFPLLPAGYEEIVPELYSADEFELVLPLADRLVNNFWQLIETQTIRVRSYQAVEEIVL